MRFLFKSIAATISDTTEIKKEEKIKVSIPTKERSGATISCFSLPNAVLSECKTALFQFRDGGNLICCTRISMKAFLLRFLHRFVIPLCYFTASSEFLAHTSAR